MTQGAVRDDPPLPGHLQLEITSACNLRCVMCLVRYRPPVNKLAGAMPAALFHRLVDEVPGLRRLTLQGLGEPLLSPYLMEMLQAATARRITVEFNSNATLLTRHRADELVDTGVDWLHVSVDGASAATYQAVRDGGCFDTVIDNLAGLVAAKRAAGSPTPWIRVVFVAMRDTVGDGGRAARAAFAEARRAAGELGLKLRLPHAGPPPAGIVAGPGCSWPWDAAYVTSAGVVQPCCMVMGDDRIRLGDLAEHTFPEIWHGDAYREFRRRLAGDDPPDVCRGCSLYRRTF